MLGHKNPQYATVHCWTQYCRFECLQFSTWSCLQALCQCCALAPMVNKKFQFCHANVCRHGIAMWLAVLGFYEVAWVLSNAWIELSTKVANALGNKFCYAFVCRKSCKEGSKALEGRQRSDKQFDLYQLSALSVITDSCAHIWNLWVPLLLPHDLSSHFPFQKYELKWQHDIADQSWQACVCLQSFCTPRSKRFTDDVCALFSTHLCPHA